MPEVSGHQVFVQISPADKRLLRSQCCPFVGIPVGSRVGPTLFNQCASGATQRGEIGPDEAEISCVSWDAEGSVVTSTRPTWPPPARGAQKQEFWGDVVSGKGSSTSVP